MVSSAVRALATWAAVAAGSGSDAEPVVDDGLLTASAEVALETLRAVPEAARTVIFVGHNPTAAYMVHLLDDGQGEPAAVRELLHGYPTGALTVLVPRVPWSELGPESARVVDFHVGRA